MRTDTEIKRDVQSALKWSSEIKEEDIGVTVHNKGLRSQPVALTAAENIA
jgi:hypothetical protein